MKVKLQKRFEYLLKTTRPQISLNININKIQAVGQNYLCDVKKFHQVRWISYFTKLLNKLEEIILIKKKKKNNDTTAL